MPDSPGRDDDTAEATEEDRLLADLLRLSLRHEDVVPFLDGASRLLQRFFHTWTVGVWLVEKPADDGEAILRLGSLAFAAGGVPAEERDAIRERFARLPLDGDLLAQRVVATGLPSSVTVDEVQGAGEAAMRRIGATSLLGLPLPGSSGPLGVVVVAMDRRREMEPSRQRLLSHVVGHLGLLLDRYQLGDVSRSSREEARLLGEAVRRLPGLIAVMDPDGTVRTVNPAVRDILGYEAEDLQGRNLVSLLHDADPTEPPGTYLDDFRGEVMVRAADGTPVPLFLILAAIRDDEGDPTSLVGVAHDLSEEKMRERQLQEASRLATVGELASGVAHEVNNPLGTITTVSELLLEDEELSDGVRKDVEAIRGEARRAGEIVHNLLSFARDRDVQREEVALRDVVDKALILKRRALELVDIEVTVEAEEELPRVLADPNQLQQVVNNLLTNARHAIQVTWDGGEIRIVLRRTGSDVELMVEDTGPGIPRDRAEEIFRPFVTTKRAGHGTGLGLAISRGIVRAHGGELEVENWGRPRVDGGGLREGGARFVMRLPRGVRPGGTGPHVRGGRTAALAGLRILVVEDEPVLAEALRRYLSRREMEVEVALRAEAALEMLDRDRGWDVILSDLRMPGLGGLEFFRRLREDHPGLVKRVIFTSGDVANEETLDFLARTGRPVLPKPFELGDLVELVADVVAGEA